MKSQNKKLIPLFPFAWYIKSNGNSFGYTFRCSMFQIMKLKNKKYKLFSYNVAYKKSQLKIIKKFAFCIHDYDSVHMSIYLLKNCDKSSK